MFPICDDTTVACFQYNGNALDGTPTHAVGVSVNVLRDLNSETDCNTIDTGSGPIRTIRIHGTTFHYGETGEAGLGSGRSMTVYRTLHRHVCFEVALVTAGRNLGPQDVKDEGLHTVSRLAWRRISNYMDRMLYSFTFVGPVKDGPDWCLFRLGLRRNVRVSFFVKAAKGGGVFERGIRFEQDHVRAGIHLQRP